MASAADNLAKNYGLYQPLELDKAATRAVATVLEDASHEAYTLMLANASKLETVSGVVTQQRLRLAMNGFGQLSSELWDSVGVTTQSGIYTAAHLAADQQLDLDWIGGMPGRAVLSYAERAHLFASQSAEDLISKGMNNIPLSDAIYAHGKETVQKVGRIVERGLALQKSARELAQDVRGHFDPKVPGGSSYASMRLARTEINNAHHTTTIRNAQNRPWVEGMKWNLSSSHPKPDECDLWANRVFPTKDVPKKPHPSCFCFLTHVQPEPDEFLDNLLNGDYDNWMARNGVRC